jgi:hypothetical protein
MRFARATLFLIVIIGWGWGRFVGDLARRERGIVLENERNRTEVIIVDRALEANVVSDFRWWAIDDRLLNLKAWVLPLLIRDDRLEIVLGLPEADGLFVDLEYPDYLGFAVRRRSGLGLKLEGYALDDSLAIEEKDVCLFEVQSRDTTKKDGCDSEDKLVLTLENLMRDLCEICGFDHVRRHGVIMDAELPDGVDSS